MSFYISRKLSFASTRLFIFDYKLFIVNYQSNMKDAVDTMLMGAAEAESAGNLIKKVWSNAIHNFG